ncbi:hypothetical protein SAMN05444156_1121 [Verrucomicrobium sp. GAS474]|uniref:hypothetical protein n=1 Tax=Verrucomicrobium sp. GAS474 TaxID=1882831 RepID=UPI00087AFB12|nr:hypothetical protein [Verrucomicrobium sp. GAS474]SDT96584.1 hypothetical protein SAMN05444156_1121 [Verrucomicrobium sp. GAS474]
MKEPALPSAALGSPGSFPELLAQAGSSPASEASLYARIPAEARHAIEAATGYWELGMSVETLREIRLLAGSPDPEVAAVATEPHVQRFLLLAFMDLGLWASALSVADALDAVARIEADFADIPLKAAFCLHELGRTHDARQRLYEAPAAARDTALYHYDLACYECRLGRLAPATQHLAEALRRDASLRSILDEDANLAPIRHLVVKS